MKLICHFTEDDTAFHTTGTTPEGLFEQLTRLPEATPTSIYLATAMYSKECNREVDQPHGLKHIAH